ncbi:MAG: ABC transporter substrate-binding protein [Candidatus Brocadiia bacterium]
MTRRTHCRTSRAAGLAMFPAALVSALLLCAVLLSCERADPPEDGLTRPALRVSYLPHLSFAPFMVAREEGYFEQAGVDVEYVDLKRSAHGVAALAQGDLDVLSGFLSVGVLNAIRENAGIKIVACKGYAAPGRDSYNVILAREDLGPHDELTGERLHGCRVLTGVDSFQAPFTESFLARWDLTLDDVEASRIPAPAQLPAIAQGDADLAATTEPWATRILDAGHAYLIARAGDVVPGFQYGYVAFGPGLLEDDREAGRRFMVGYLRAIRRLRRGKTAGNLDVLAAASGLDRDLLTRAAWPSFHSDGRIDVESLLEFQNWAVKRNLMRAPLQVESFWEPAFVEHADAVLRDEKAPAGVP